MLKQHRNAVRAEKYMNTEDSKIAVLLEAFDYSTVFFGLRSANNGNGRQRKHLQSTQEIAVRW